MSFRRSLAVTGAVLTAAAALLTLPSSTAGADPGQHDRAETRGLVAHIRKATAQYRDLAVARDAGYHPVGHCVASPEGGMGVHYLKQEYAAPGPVDPAKPALLLYAPDRNGTPQLVAVEYFQPDVGQIRPTLDGEPFDGPMPGHEPGMPAHFDLHVWTEVANPDGVFTSWNPKVEC